MSSKIPRYLAATMAYGFTRHCAHVYNGKVKRYNSEKRDYEAIPLLFVDKAMIVTIGTGASCYLWPLYLWNDLAWLEFKLDKTKKPEDYGYDKVKRSYSEYFFT